LAFYFLSITLKYIPVGIAYALWAGLGIIIITIVGLVVFGQKLDSAAIIGLTMIILGIVVIHLFSSTSSH
jgi:small multidrug resistance pump